MCVCVCDRDRETITIKEKDAMNSGGRKNRYMGGARRRKGKKKVI